MYILLYLLYYILKDNKIIIDNIVRRMPSIEVTHRYLLVFPKTIFILFLEIIYLYKLLYNIEFIILVYIVQYYETFKKYTYS